MKLHPSESSLPLIDRSKTGPMDSQSNASQRIETDFDASFERHWASIYRLLERMLGNADEAEDVALEAFYRLHREQSHLEHGTEPGGWLYRVALNLGLHALRSARRRARYEEAGGKLWLEAQTSTNPLEIVSTREEHELARQALGRMNPKRSQLLVLRYSGMSYKDIAAALNLSVTSIGPLLVRAEREFEQCYRLLGQEES